MSRERCKQVLLFLLLPLVVVGLLALAFLFLPMYMLAMMFVKPYQMAVERTTEPGCCAVCCGCEDE